MADMPDTDQFGFLTHKVGPLPVWGWATIAVGIYYWYTHYGPGAGSGTSSATASNAQGNGENVTETLKTSTGPVTINRTSSSEPITVPPKTPSPNPVNEILTGGHVIDHNPGHAEIGWTIKQQSPLAKKIKVVLNGPGHKNQTRYIPANATTATASDLEAGHTYVFDVTPVDAEGQAVGGPNHVTLVTSRSVRPAQHTPPRHK